MRYVSIALLFLSPVLTIAQGTKDQHKVKRWLIWYTPSKADVINGITLSPIESFYFYEDRSQQFNGLVLHAVGIMLFPLFPGDPNDLFAERHPHLTADKLVAARRQEDADSSKPVIAVNGVLLSLTGTITSSCNGINISPWFGMNSIVNGITLNAMYNMNSQLKGLGLAIVHNSSFSVKGAQIALSNSAYSIEGFQLGLINRNRPRSRVKGVQIGLFNKTDYIQGIQIGLFNKNRYRSLPIVNWGFKGKNDRSD